MTVTFKVTNTTNIEGHEDWEVEVVTNRGHVQVSLVTLKPGESTDCYAYRDQEIWVRHSQANERKADREEEKLSPEILAKAAMRCDDSCNHGFSTAEIKALAQAVLDAAK
jgi:hypothetical protein